MFLALNLVLWLTDNQQTNDFSVMFVETKLRQSSWIYLLILTNCLVSKPRIIFHHYSTIPSLDFHLLLGCDATGKHSRDVTETET